MIALARRRWWSHLLPLGVCLMGCGPDVGPAEADCAPGTADAAAADTAAPDSITAAADASGGVAEDGDGAGGGWSLSPCQRACDRVVSCGVSGCSGWSWAGAGELQSACATACDAPLAEKILGASHCDAVREVVATRDSRFASRCRANPCQLACLKVAGCVVNACELIGAGQQDAIAAACQQGCAPATASWVLGKQCPAIVEAIASKDPKFNQKCHPSASECASSEVCAAYAKKATGCIVAHCAGNADAWQAGIAAVVADYCHKDKACPDKASVALVVGPGVTCQSPGMKQLGPAPPFTALCAGTLGVTAAEAKLACDKLVACPGLEAAGSAEKCMVLLAMRPDVLQRVTCLKATSACAQVYACLEGM